MSFWLFVIPPKSVRPRHRHLRCHQSQEPGLLRYIVWYFSSSNPPNVSKAVLGERQMRIHRNTSTTRQRVSSETHLLALRAGMNSPATRVCATSNLVSIERGREASIVLEVRANNDGQSTVHVQQGAPRACPGIVVGSLRALRVPQLFARTRANRADGTGTVPATLNLWTRFPPRRQNGSMDMRQHGPDSRWHLDCSRIAVTKTAELERGNDQCVGSSIHCP
jgi:hypothetical protein